MELYTVVSEKSENSITANDGIIIEKKKYSNKELKKFLEICKHYYVKTRTESFETDFNDKYSSDDTIYTSCNHLNVVIKDDEVYGFITYGLERNKDKCVILTFDENHYNLYEGSCYSNVERDFHLCKYELSEEVLDIAVKYKIEKETVYYKIINGEEKYDETYHRTFYLTAFDVLCEDEKPVAIKYDKAIIYLEKLYLETDEIIKLGAMPYHKFDKYRLVEL